jgi:hypothetical protein
MWDGEGEKKGGKCGSALSFSGLSFHKSKDVVITIVST